MCTVSITIDEATLREMMPELDSKAAIRQWAQEQIDLRLRELVTEDTETMSIEEAREMTLKLVRVEYAWS